MVQQREPKPQLQPNEAVLKTYTGEQIPVLGIFNVVVAYEGNQKKLTIPVVKGTQSCLLGWEWLNEIQINWHEI